jgi:hypothetical protein
VSWQLVQWAMSMSPMLTTERGKNDTTARFVLVSLAEKARGEEPRAWPSITTLRYMTGLDREVIRRALRRLADGGLITDVGRRGEGVVCWQLNTDRVRPETDLKAIEAEVDERREKDRLRKQQARSTEDASTVLSRDSDPVSELKTADSTVLSRDSTVLRLDSTTQHSREPLRTGDEPVSEPIPAEQASAEAPALDEPPILDAEIVGEEPASEALFDTPQQPLKQPRRKKPVDPEKQARLDQAHDLADRYYRAKNRMVKFMAVRGIVVKALENYPYDVVFEGVKRMATVDRDRPFTLDTLRSAIERATGVAPATARGGDPLGHLAPGDQIQVRTEFLKSRPNWERLRRYGITPDNASLYGFRAS